MPLLFIAIPLIELYFIIVVGEAIGAFWTVMLVILTAVVGVTLLRLQGMSTLMRAQRNMSQGQIPAMEMMEGIALAVAGVLLITPGFITDFIGFLCLVPASRRAIIHYLMKKATLHTSFSGFQSSHQGFQQDMHHDARPHGPKETKHGRTIEGEYKRED